MKKKKSLFFTALFFIITSCSLGVANVSSDSNPISHQIWDGLLKKHVSKDGNVNYVGFISDKAILEKYLTLLSANYPNDKNWNKNDQLAYWINTYNAFTIQLIINHYPLKSIKDIGSKLSISGLNSIWDYKFITIEGKKMNLNDIEHNILRKKFDEFRIHFAIVCASASCPILRPEAFVGSKIDQQLQKQTIDFINDDFRNNITEKKIKISKLFDWFRGDFTKKSNLIEFLNKYSKTNISKSAKISYLDYDWSLNEQ